MSATTDTTDFVERIRRERVERGLPPTIVDLDALRLIGALAARRGGGADANAS